MQNIELYIENNNIDINGDIQFAITKEFKNIDDPTTIINTWSKTINIPFTPNNNRIFGSIYNGDKDIIYGQEQTGIYFDPTKKLDFYLMHNNDIIMNGYAKLTEISSEKGYSINLFGEIGKVFSELKKLTPMLTDEIREQKYLINPIEAEGFYINKENVAKCWTNERDQSDPDVFMSKIGFVPFNNAYFNDFQSDMVYTRDPQTGNEFFGNFTDILGDQYDKSIYTPEAIIGDGLLPRAFAEYRSYNLQPYIYVDSLFNELVYKTKLLTDYTLQLDENWFNFDNPYYGDSVMLLKTLDHTVQNKEIKATFASTPGSLPTWNQSQLNEIRIKQINFQNLQGYIENNKIISINKETTTTAKQQFNLFLSVKGGVLDHDIMLADNSAIFVYASFENDNDQTKFIRPKPFIIIANNDNEENYKQQGNVIKIKDAFEQIGTQWIYRLTIPLIDAIPLQEFELLNNVKMNLSFAIIPNQNGNIIRDTRSRGEGAGEQLSSGFYLDAGISNDSFINLEISSNHHRSNDWIEFKDLWDADKNFFDIILNYTKMHNLFWDIDIFNKTITIKKQSDYFKEDKENIEDWTNKVDFSKDFKITPIVFDNKYLKFGGKNESTLGESYLNKYGGEFGDLTLQTVYQFNEDSTDILKDINIPIINTETFLTWGRIIKGNIVYEMYKEPMICLGDKDNKMIDQFGAFMFYRGLKEFDILDGRDVRLSDDNLQMRQADKYCYCEDGIYVQTYPWLDIIFPTEGEKLIYSFGTPYEKYDVTQKYDNAITLYENFFKDYLDEMNNKQNYKLSANINVTPQEFAGFKHSQLKIINGQLFLVNKINDYNIKNEFTKCEFIHLMHPEKLQR